MWHHFFPLLFPKDSESLKILDIRLREMGAKRPLNGTSKSEQTHTHTHTDIWTNWLIESIGPEGRCFENCFFASDLLWPQTSEPNYKKFTQPTKADFLVLQLLIFLPSGASLLSGFQPGEMNVSDEICEQPGSWHSALSKVWYSDWFCYWPSWESNIMNL